MPCQTNTSSIENRPYQRAALSPPIRANRQRRYQSSPTEDSFIMAKTSSTDEITSMLKGGHMTMVEVWHLLDGLPLLPRYPDTLRDLAPFTLCLKHNNTSSTAPCPLCGRPYKPPTGYVLFIDGGWDPVCDDCGQKHALELWLAMDAARERHPDPNQGVADWIAEDDRVRTEWGLPKTQHRNR
jgi:hypothetical protein